jgi:hypothetical protein
MIDVIKLTISLFIAFIFWFGILYFIFKGTFALLLDKLIKFAFIVLWVEQLLISIPVKWLTGRFLIMQEEVDLYPYQ